MAMGGLLGICVLLALHHVRGTTIKDPECKREGHFMLHPTNRCQYLHCTLSLRSGRQNHYQAITQECPLGTGVSRHLYEKQDPDYSSRSTLCTDRVPYGSVEACRVLDLSEGPPEGKSLRPSRDYSGQYESFELEDDHEDDFSSEREDYEERHYRKRTGRHRDTSQESPHKWYNILVENQLQEDLQSREDDHLQSREESRETSRESYLQTEDQRRHDTWRDKYEPTRYSSNKRRYKGSHYQRRKMASSPHGKSWKHGGRRRDGSYERSTNRGYGARRSISDPQFSGPHKGSLPKMKFQYKSKARTRNPKPPHSAPFSSSMEREFSRRSYSGNTYRKSDFDNDYYSSRKSAKKDFDDNFFTDPYHGKKEFDTNFYSRMGSAKKGPSTDFFSSPSFSKKDSRSGFRTRKYSGPNFFSSPSFSSKEDSSGFGASKSSSTEFFSSPTFPTKSRNSGFRDIGGSNSNFFSSPSFSKKDISSGFGASKGSSSDVFSNPGFPKKDSTSDFFSSNSPSGSPFPSTFDKKDFYKDFKYDYPYGKHGSNIGRDQDSSFVNKDGKKGVNSKNTFNYENPFGKDSYPYDYNYKYPYDSNPFSKQNKGSDKAVPSSQGKRGNNFGNNRIFTKSSGNGPAKVTPYPWNNLGYVVVHTTPSPALHGQNSQAQQGQSNAYKPAENAGGQSNVNTDTQSSAQSAANVQSASNARSAAKFQSPANVQSPANLQSPVNVRSPANVKSASNVQSDLRPVQQQQQRQQNTKQLVVNSPPSSTSNGNYGNAGGQTNQNQGQSNGKKSQGSSQSSPNQGGSPTGNGGQYHPMQRNVQGGKQVNQGGGKDSAQPHYKNPMLPYTYTPSYLVDWYSKVTGVNSKTGDSSVSPKVSQGTGARNGEWRKKPSESSSNTKQSPAYSQPMPRDWPSKFARYKNLGLGTKTIGQISPKSSNTGHDGRAQGDKTQHGFGKSGFGDKYQGFGRSSPRYGRGGPLQGGKQVALGETKSNIEEPLYHKLESDQNQNSEKVQFEHEVAGKSVEVDGEGGGIKIRYHGGSRVSLADRGRGEEPQSTLEYPVLPRPPQEDENQELDNRKHHHKLEQRGGEVENATPASPPTSPIPRLPRDIVADIVDRAYDQNSKPALKFDSEIAETEEVEPNFFFSRS